MASKARIHDVAALAKVSIKTVSRVVNNEPNVRRGTREKVQRAIKKLSYRPNPSARSLAGNRSYLIGLLYDNPSASYVTGIQTGVLAACQAAGYQLLIYPSDSSRTDVADSITSIVRHSHMDGVILTPPLSDMKAIVAALDAQGTPLARVAPADRSDIHRSVYTNDRQVCSRMTDFLISLGHERIGFIIGHPGHGSVGHRHLGYLDAIRQIGAVDKKLVAQGYNSFDSGIDAAHKLLALSPRPSAIFASNDDMAAGVLTVAHEMGLSVPNELSVAGFDDIPLAKQVWPALTTICQPISIMAEKAAKLLLGRLQGRPSGVVDHTTESIIVLRESTGAPQARRIRARTATARGSAAGSVRAAGRHE